MTGDFRLATAFRPALGPIKPPIQWVPGGSYLGIKGPGPKANQLPPSSEDVKNDWSYASSSQHLLMAWCLVKHRDNLIFHIYL
jgi:hypothetical protein